MVAAVVRIEIDASGAQRMFARVLETAANPPMGAIADVLEQRVRQTFRDEADPWGVPWPAHSPVTTKGRTKRGNTRASLLIDTGAMFSTIRREATQDSAVVSIGGGDTWPVVHQFGNPDNLAWGGPSAPIPARPMFPIRANGTAELPGDWLREVVEPIAAAMEVAVE